MFGFFKDTELYIRVIGVKMAADKNGGVLLVTYFLLTVSARAQIQDCPYEGCYCSDVAIMCENLQLTSIPALVHPVPAKYNTFFIASNFIKTIPAGSLPSNMSEINLADNPIAAVDPQAFNESRFSLQTLTFSNALLTTIPDAFSQLKALQKLFLVNTPIQDWNQPAMSSLAPTLQWLDLENVSLTSWPGWLQDFTSLTQLTINHAVIPVLPDDGLLTQSKTLVSLVLINDSLTRVPPALLTLRALQVLQLQMNRITDVSSLPRQSPLTSLFLSNNLISDAVQLSQTLLPFSETLSQLALNQNSLTSIPEFIFLAKVLDFDYSNNRISNPLSGSVPNNTYELDLSYNFLPMIPVIFSLIPQVSVLIIPYNSVRQITADNIPIWITLLELGFNLITQITDSSFPPNSQLATLHLNNNPLKSVSSLAFQNVHHLAELNLQNTQLTRLPLALKSLTSLVMFDVTGSDHLVCTCEEKSLQHWVVALTVEDVMGQCGMLSVYEFFSRYSSDCP